MPLSRFHSRVCLLDVYLTLSLVSSVLLAGCYDNRAVDYIDIPTTMLEPDAAMRTTGQSYNQSVVSNDNGIFLTYKVDENATYYATYYLLRSTDGGQTFTQLYTERAMTITPTLETDADNNVYLMHLTNVEGVSDKFIQYYKFSPPDYELSISNSFADSEITVNGGKMAMALDQKRNRIYFMAYMSPYLHSLNKEDGSHIDSIHLLTDSPNQTHYTYPQLVVDGNGILHFAWTTEGTVAEEYAYQSIHHMKSSDGGYTWRKMDGTSLILPVVWDWAGNADEITDTDEHNVHTWLSSFMPKNGKVHFMYQNKGIWDVKYKRYDFNTGALEIDRTGLSDGKVAINGFDGIFVTDFNDADSPLFIVGHEGHSGSNSESVKLVSLVSYDNGTTWRSYAKSEDEFHRLYSVGGSRQLTSDGHIIGTFANITEDRGGYGDQSAQAIFYKIPTGAPQNYRKAHEFSYKMGAGQYWKYSTFGLALNSGAAHNGLSQNSLFLTGQ